MAAVTWPATSISLAEFEALFAAVRNWGRWGPDDQLGTLNYITPDTIRRAARPRPLGASCLDAGADQHGGRA